MSMPKPAPEMKELRDMIGVWATDEKFEQTPFMPAGTATGTNTVRLGPGGFSILMEQRSKSTMGPFTGHGVFTWDANGNVYKSTWVDSMTPGMVVETGRKEGANLVFTGEATMMGKKMTIKDVMSDRTAAFLHTDFLHERWLRGEEGDDHQVNQTGIARKEVTVSNPLNGARSLPRSLLLYFVRNRITTI